MASLPPRSSGARRSRASNSREDQTSSSSDSPERFRSSDQLDNFSNDAQTSETVFPHTSTPSSSTNHTAAQPSADKSSSKELDPTDEAAADAPTAPTNSSGSSEPRKCWICYTDETEEESPMNTEWRSPCPCALTAHESCLLDWLADMENPKSPRRTGGSTAKMLCPQCQSEIVISRPRSLVADFVRWAERVVGRMVFPGVAFTLAGTIWAGCCAHGAASMYLVFGREEVQRIFESGSRSPWNPRLNVGVPLIPLILVFSRTRYAEGLLPAIPVLFFATHQPGGHELELDMWPPSPSVTFAALPYAKSFYCMLYEKLFGKLERKWLAEVQPRLQSSNNNNDDGQQPQQGEGQQQQQQQGQGQGQAQEQQAGGEGGAHAGGNRGAEQDPDGQVLMEIELQVGVPDFRNHLRVGRDAGEQNGAQNGDGQGAEGGQQPGEGEENQILGRRQDNIINNSSQPTDTVLGALAFPVISATMGGILKLALPRGWTTRQAGLFKARSGLLDSKWGRSVVGGCLFVLIKDALVLYCRWKLAQSHRKRKVLNYDRNKEKIVEP